MGGTGWRRKVKTSSQTRTLEFVVKYLLQASEARTTSIFFQHHQACKLLAGASAWRSDPIDIDEPPELYLLGALSLQSEESGSLLSYTQCWVFFFDI